MTAAPDFEVADLFCGAGGTSTGAEAAVRELGRTMRLVAINHWPLAIETHQKNHPSAEHYVEDLTVADPTKIVPRGYLDLLMASPECTFHSNARGGKPIHDQARMDPWAIHRWLTRLDVRCVLIENVPEFRWWGPLLPSGKPDPKKKGEYFEAWVQTFWGLGYKTEWHILNAADYGDATTRRRFFLQARKDGKPIAWPEPSHAQNPDTMFGKRKRWRAAREVINWENRGASIFSRKIPLSLNTRRRAAEGFRRFSGPLAELYIALLDIPERGVSATDAAESTVGPAGQPRQLPDRLSGAATFVMGKQSRPVYRDLDSPLPTLTTMATPLLVETCAELVGGNRNNNIPRPLDEPIPTATGAPGGGLYVVEVTAEPFILGQQSGSVARSVDDPMMTIATEGAISFVEPLILPYYRTGVVHSTDEPLHTVTTRDRFGLAQALVVPYGPRAEARDVGEPMHTITTKDRLALAEAEAFIVSRHSNDLLRPVEEPIPTATTRGAGYLVKPEAFIVPNFGERNGQQPRVHAVEDPCPTVTGRGAGNLVAAVLLQVNHGDHALDGSRVRSVDEPTWAATTIRNVALAEPIIEEIRAGRIDKRRLVIIDDQLCMLDIRFRMLENDELAKAMGFTDLERTYEFVGNKGEVTKQIGNAVPVRTAAALVKAILGA